MRIGGVDIEAVFGCVPSDEVDNVAALTPLVGAGRAEEIVRATGFPSRRVAPEGADVIDLVLPAARLALEGVAADDIGGVIGVSFSGRDRFPALATRLQSALALPNGIAAYDLSMACSGWIYGLFAAAQLVRASGKKVLLADGDVQSPWIDPADASTLAVMGDGAAVALLSPGEGTWDFGFFTDGAGAETLSCRETIRMDGFGVFRFVAGPVKRFIASFMQETPLLSGGDAPLFVPHQANMYMVRQLAEALGLGERLVSGDARHANTGSCSAALALARAPIGETATRTPVLMAGFGAGLSAGVAATALGAFRKGVVEL